MEYSADLTALEATLKDPNVDGVLCIAVAPKVPDMAFIDADTIADPQLLERLAGCYDDENIAGAGGRGLEVIQETRYDRWRKEVLYQGGLGNCLILILFNILFFAGAYVVFLRYDVR